MAKAPKQAAKQAPQRAPKRPARRTARSPSSPTALERALSSSGPPRATPLDALHAARRMWLADQRIDMGALAAELGISRATLYNWVGGRERLTAEVLWAIAEATIAEAREDSRGSGTAYVF